MTNRATQRTGASGRARIAAALCRIVPLTAVAITLLSAVTAALGQDSSASAERPTLFIIGDSTVKNGHQDGVGWGERIAQFFDTDEIEIQNHAIGGRSSRTFRTEGRWQRVLDAAEPGDFVLIQFGHNDGIAPDDPQRPRGSLRGTGEETMDMIHPQTGEPETVHTYGWYMRQYVKEAREKGMIPIVCSYVPRAPRRNEGPIDPSLSMWGQWAKDVADEEDAAFIDLYGRVARKYAEMEKNAPHSVKEQFFVGGDRDYTHTVEAGAIVNAQTVVEGIQDLEGEAGELAKYLKEDAPTTQPADTDE